MAFIDFNLVIMVFSALAAALSFVAFAIPYLKRTEKKEQIQQVIQKRRKVLFEEAKAAATIKGKTDDKLTARESMSAQFMVERLGGKMAEDARSMMLQAGIRSPTAPLKFLVARIVLPIILSLFVVLVLSSGEEEVSGAIKLVSISGAVLLGYFMPKLLIKNQIQKRQEEINLSFPDALDMMLICVQGGIGLEQAVNRVSSEVVEYSPTLAEELSLLSAELGMLNDRRGAFQDFARRVGSGAARSFATAMIQAEQYGTSVTQAMRVMSDELRDMRMAAAEQKAAALPPKLTVPMIAFFLPALFIVILGPAVIKAMGVASGGG